MNSYQQKGTSLIPFLDIKSSYTSIKVEINQAIQRVLESGQYILGPEVEQFESAFNNYVSSSDCIGLANGLDALTIGLRALGVKKGDEVIVPSNTYIATWLAVSAVGATIIPVEPDVNTYCLSPENTESAITSKTKVILPVHLFGHTADLPALWELCEKYDLRMLEDAAQSQGACINGIMIGESRDLVAWSFYPGKNLGAMGDAGAITTNNNGLAKLVRVLGNYGSEKKYVNKTKGYNSRLDPIQAAVLSVKLKYLTEWNLRRKSIAKQYTQAFKNLDLKLPILPTGLDSVWHQYVIMTPQRDKLKTYLHKNGIETLIHYPIPPFKQEAYIEYRNQQDKWPLANKFANQSLSLPIGPHMHQKDLNYIIDEVKCFFNG